MTLEQGKLRLSKKNKPTIEMDGNVFNPSEGEFSQSILDHLESLNGQEVEFERVGGQPKKIRKLGEDFLAPKTTVVKAEASKKSSPKQGQSHSQDGATRRSSRPRSNVPNQPQPRKEQHDTPMPKNPDFHNPYNFVPAPPRNTNDSELGDHCPAGQDSFHSNRYTGQIRVQMLTKTPLLLPDTANVREDQNGHKTYPLQVDEQGKPLVPASGVRGMLRTAYEIITNSRFGKFDQEHQKKLEYRETQHPYNKVPYHLSPWDLLCDCLKPADDIQQLSPADRVFGWVRAEKKDSRTQGTQQEPVATRGLLRVGSVTCKTDASNAVETFSGQALPLAILSTPKPQQGRFYVAKSSRGEAQDHGLSKVNAGYSRGKGLRGRKVYPHQKSLPSGHWNDPLTDRTQQMNGAPDHYQEYRRPKKHGREQRDDQNRSILGWVKPDTQFSFSIHVHNLSKVELGALLWLLSLPADHFLRFGGGKPLGFGSVHLTIESCEVYTGNELSTRYDSWESKPKETDVQTQQNNIKAFQDALCQAYPSSNNHVNFDDIPFIRAFLVGCKGFDDELPIHYPRATENGDPGPPNPDGESFRWFVANEKNSARYVLQDLSEETGLPTLKRT